MYGFVIVSPSIVWWSILSAYETSIAAQSSQSVFPVFILAANGLRLLSKEIRAGINLVRFFGVNFLTRQKQCD